MAICHNKQYENEFVRLMQSQGHHCERVAGSGSGRQAVCDCILFKQGQVYLVEVKATKKPEFKPNKQIREQLERMKIVAVKQNIEPMMAIKWKNRGWTYHTGTILKRYTYK